MRRHNSIFLVILHCSENTAQVHGIISLERIHLNWITDYFYTRNSLRKSHIHQPIRHLYEIRYSKAHSTEKPQHNRSSIKGDALQTPHQNFIPRHTFTSLARLKIHSAENSPNFNPMARHVTTTRVLWCVHFCALLQRCHEAVSGTFPNFGYVQTTPEASWFSCNNSWWVYCVFSAGKRELIWKLDETEREIESIVS